MRIRVGQLRSDRVGVEWALCAKERAREGVQKKLRWLAKGVETTVSVGYGRTVRVRKVRGGRKKQRTRKTASFI